MRTLLILAASLLISCSVGAQSADLRALIYGQPAQAKILRDLDGGSWTHLVVHDSNVAAPSGLEAAFRNDESEFVCYTQGKTIYQDGRTYLIAYRLKSVRADPAKLSAMFDPAKQRVGNAPQAMLEMFFPKPTAETPLSLTLIDLESLAEATDIRPASLSAELSAT